MIDFIIFALKMLMYGILGYILWQGVKFAGRMAMGFLFATIMTILEVGDNNGD